jgi:hypothetical protein
MYWCYNLIHAEMDLQAVTLVIPNTGSGPVNVFADAFLAKASAFSLPAIPQCPGTHTRVTLLGRAWERKVYKVLVGRPERRKRPLGRPRCRW